MQSNSDNSEIGSSFIAPPKEENWDIEDISIEQSFLYSTANQSLLNQSRASSTVTLQTLQQPSNQIGQAASAQSFGERIPLGKVAPGNANTAIGDWFDIRFSTRDTSFNVINRRRNKY